MAITITLIKKTYLSRQPGLVLAAKMPVTFSPLNRRNCIQPNK
jgi:hypothetical protein